MRLLLKTQGFVSLADVTDVGPEIRKSGTLGSILEPEELLRILRLAEAGLQSKKFIRARRALFPRLFDLIGEVPDFEGLIRTLKQTISVNGAIKDSASPLLRRIREKKILLRQHLEKKLEDVQRAAGLSGNRQDPLVTVRDGRYVVAVRTDQKTRIVGIVHDYSHTRSTCYLEPVEVIQDNNRAAELAQEEKAEEFRILAKLTGIIRDLADDLEHAQTVIGRLDGIFARARFSEAQSCIMPEIGTEYGVELRGAKNPILLAMSLNTAARRDGEEFPVPVDILLDSKHNVLVISGPNRGGKTVTLKTLGLMSLMAQAGIHIPAKEGSCLTIFDQVMANIGDDQDIQTGLSTFSAHVAHMKDSLEQSHGKRLVIIDEPGMGTDPDEGVALSMAVLDFLCEQGVFVAVSTHSNRLKAYGLSNKRAINASVEFDGQKNCPTFKLNYGVPGISHALEMAREMGMPSSILDNAKKYLDQDEVRLNRLIEKMNHLLLETELEKRAAKDLKEEYLARAGELKERLMSLEAEKKAMIEEKRIEAEAAIREAKEELNHAVNLLKKKRKSVQAHVTERHAEVARSLKDYFKKEARKEEENTYIDFSRFNKGRLVYHRGIKQKGFVQSADLSTGRVSVMLGNIKVQAKMEDLELIEGVQAPSSEGTEGSVSWHINSATPRELNLVGYRVDEAIPLIDKTIDRALVDGNLTLKIIHGFGTGRLRDAIRGHLRGIPFVKNVSSAEPRFGGDAITIVEL